VILGLSLKYFASIFPPFHCLNTSSRESFPSLNFYASDSVSSNHYFQKKIHTLNHHIFFIAVSKNNGEKESWSISVRLTLFSWEKPKVLDFFMSKLLSYHKHYDDLSLRIDPTYQIQRESFAEMTNLFQILLNLFSLSIYEPIETNNMCCSQCQRCLFCPVRRWLMVVLKRSHEKTEIHNIIWICSIDRSLVRLETLIIKWVKQLFL